MHKGIPFQLLGGEETSKRLVSMLNGMQGPLVCICPQVEEKLSRMQGTSALDPRMDLLYCVITLIDSYSAADGALDSSLPEALPAFLKWLHLFFNPSGSDTSGVGVVRVSTVHRSKGIEADDVFLHQLHLLPLEDRIAKGGWNADEEYCVEYVAKSRARERMIYLPSLDMFNLENVLSLFEPPSSVTGEDSQETEATASASQLGDGQEEDAVNNALLILNLPAVPESASDVNKAVKQLVFRAHPDHNFNSPESNEYTQKVILARNVLLSLFSGFA